jgi:hypothetical protein
VGEFCRCSKALLIKMQMGLPVTTKMRGMRGTRQVSASFQPTDPDCGTNASRCSDNMYFVLP